MIKYILTRLLIGLLQIWLVVSVVFVFVHLLPGDPAYIILGSSDNYEPTEAQLQKIREQLGLNLPIGEQYLNYIKGILQGNFGKSLINTRPVGADLQVRFIRTLKLVIPSVMLSSIVGILAGIVSAKNRGKWGDVVASFIAIAAHSIPAFVLGCILVLIFSLKLGWLPTSGYKDFTAGFFVALPYMVLPVITLGLRGATNTMRMSRTSIIEQMGLDYVRTARAKGVKEQIVLYRHILRNALLPVVTVIGLQLGVTFGDALVVENIFNWPGLATFLRQGINTRDYPIIQGSMIVYAIVFIVANLITDISYAFLDPRISVGE